ncbi:MAG: hypothetical protein WDM86_00450 [Rhizomicrobium sp.]
MTVVPAVIVKVDPDGGPVTVHVRIAGTQINTSTSVVFKPQAGAPQILLSTDPRSDIDAPLPGAAATLPGSQALCDVAITAMAANQHWSVTFTAMQNLAAIGGSDDSGDLAAQADHADSVLTLVFA